MITLLIIIITGLSGKLLAQQYSAAVEAKIKQVENGLAGQVVIEGTKDINLQDRMKQMKIPGLSIAVIHNYKIEWVKCYGITDSSSKKPVTPQSLFQAASLSKSINGVGAMKLVQDKKLELDKDINTYLKSWKFPYDSVSRGIKITLAKLLSHTAGLTIHGFPGMQTAIRFQPCSRYWMVNNQPIQNLSVRHLSRVQRFSIQEVVQQSAR